MLFREAIHTHCPRAFTPLYYRWHLVKPKFLHRNIIIVYALNIYRYSVIGINTTYTSKIIHLSGHTYWSRAALLSCHTDAKREVFFYKQTLWFVALLGRKFSCQLSTTGTPSPYLHPVHGPWCILYLSRVLNIPNV